jgi:hypothetical protein
MIRRSRNLRVAAIVAVVLFVLINAGGVVYAVARGELIHAMIHVGLLLVAAYPISRLARWREYDLAWRGGRSATSVSPDDSDARLARIEQSVDAVAIEVERIGEGQRFVTQLVAERGAPRAPGVRAAEVAEGKAQ